MKTKDHFSRRAVLKGLGASTIMLPLLDAETSVAQGALQPRRLVCVTMANGNVPDDFHAFHSGGSETLEPLQPFRNQVITLRGVGFRVMVDRDERWGGHSSYPCVLTGSYNDGRAAHASIDQVVAQHFESTRSFPRPYLNLGVRSERAGRQTSWRGPGEANSNETDSGRLFESLFSSPSLPPEVISNLQVRRASVLDFLGKDLEAFRARMGTEDRDKIGAHLASIRELEKELQSSATAPECTTPEVDTSDGVPERMNAMFLMTAAALKCDMTRVVTIELYDNGGGNGNTFPWIGVNRDYHELAHAGSGAYGDKRRVDRWLFEQVAVLVSELADAPEGDRTALENSLILVSNDMDTGSNHSVDRINYAIIGSAGGYLNTGRHVSVDGEPHNKLLTTVANAMGLEVDRFGTDYAGALPELVA